MLLALHVRLGVFGMRHGSKLVLGRACIAAIHVASIAGTCFLLLLRVYFATSLHQLS